MYSKLLVVLFVLSSVALNAQVSTNSPYSSQGIGDASFYGTAFMSGLGGASTALIDSSQVNLFNPSSYSHLAKQLPMFSVGIMHRRNRFSLNGIETEGNYTGITHMSLVIPFADRFGLAFGLKPYSRRGYDVNNYEVINGDSIFYDYEGSGEIQEFLLGFSAQIIKKRNHSFSIGVNGKHYFGRLDNTRKAYIKDNNFGEIGGMDQRFMRARALGFEIGANYRFTPNKTNNFTLGLTYRPEQNLNFIQSESRIFYTGFTNISSYDTIVEPVNVDGEVTSPSRLSAGFTYEFLPIKDSSSRNSRLPKLLLTGEYTLENWANYRESFGTTLSNPNFKNSSALRVGVEYTPHRKVSDRSAYVNFYHKFSYRVGAYSVNTPYSVDGEQLVDQGVSFGIGIPIVINRAISTVNISANYGSQDGSGSPNVIKENYYGFNLGINIAPSYDRWFRKYKLD
ncbi:MAG: hypothetical protein COA32_03190 [Fluviicola sp.]|nr:MAG: hypothetical protein COA32_03190 [Fluviicola sp.]